MQRVFLFVLDSLGAGALPDAAGYGDAGSDTLRAVMGAKTPTLSQLGLYHTGGYGHADITPAAAYGKCAEASLGKDTITGHWEIAGIVTAQRAPTFPQGFPTEVIEQITAQTGYGVLGNEVASGVEIIERLGQRHLLEKKLIVYTSADSVLQIAAHEELVPLSELYTICTTVRNIMQGQYGVSRIIARPFTGAPGNFTRTENRRDFSLPPPDGTMLDVLHSMGHDTIAIGKIGDIFCEKGISQSLPAHGNAQCLQAVEAIAAKPFYGLAFINLVDFDMLYGHRRDVAGYQAALERFDVWLGNFLPQLLPEDVVVLTADHGCDPTFAGTDHTREYIPLLVYGQQIAPQPLGIRPTFADIGQTVADIFGLKIAQGTSFLAQVRRDI